MRIPIEVILLNHIGNLLNDIKPSDYLESAKNWVSSGAQIIGGCCGIGVEEIKALSILKN